MTVTTCTATAVASCTGTNPRFWRRAIQESDFMKSEAKLNAKNPLRVAKKFMNFSSAKPPGLLDIFLYFFRKYVLQSGGQI